MFLDSFFVLFIQNIVSLRHEKINIEGYEYFLQISFTNNRLYICFI